MCHRTLPQSEHESYRSLSANWSNNSYGSAIDTVTIPVRPRKDPSI